MFVAVHYVRVKGKTYMPGEHIEDDPNAEWHLEKGAIRELEASPSAPSEKNDEEAEGSAETHEMTEEESREMTRENYALQLRGMGYDPSGNPLPPDASGDEAEDTETEEESEEEYEDAEPPEIDVADSIVTVEEEPEPAKKPEKAAPKRRARKEKV